MILTTLLFAYNFVYTQDDTGTPYNLSKEYHTWNRVYFESSWWNLDVTFDIVQTKNQGKLYGFHHIKNIFFESAFSRTDADD